jgi:hypothetical protein
VPYVQCVKEWRLDTLVEGMAFVETYMEENTPCRAKAIAATGVVLKDIAGRSVH